MHRLGAAAAASSPRLISFVGFLQHSAAHRFCRFTPPMLIKRRYDSKSKMVSKGIPMAARHTKLKTLSEQDGISHILWWKEKMQMCRKPSAVQLVKRLTDSNLLGLDTGLRNGSLKEGMLNSEILQFKLKFPREVMLCRVGDFYEAIGFDACILVEHAGLNPFGGLRSGSIPKAGCPLVNLRQTLDDLTRSGFSVCIVEEVQGPSQARSRKGRFISGHAHPGSPYVFGLAAAEHDVDFPEPMPVVGISRSAKGYCMISVLETMKTFSAMDGLTEEAIVTKLRTCRYHHLFLHTSLRHNPSGTSKWGEFGEGGLLWGECREKTFEWYNGIPIEAILCKVREVYGLDPEAPFRNVTISFENRPQPLLLGTATQIGVIPTEGIPSLLKVLLPSNCVGLPKLYIRCLLLNPPTKAVASDIQEACRLINNVTCSVPDFTCLSAAKIVKLLELKEANHLEFCRIKNVADEILQMHRNPELRAILHALLEPAWMETGLKVEYELLVKECDWISQKIREIIFLDDEGGQEINSYKIVPRGFFEDIESSWKCRVKKTHAVDVFEEVDSAANNLSVAVTQDFSSVIARVKAVVSASGGPKGEICYAREHEAVWLKGKRLVPLVPAGKPGEEQIKQLRPATDSKGRKVGEEWFTTSNVENALNRYHEANDTAKAKVLELLRGLSAILETKINVLVFSSMLLVIARALFGHVSEGRRREWVLPTLYGSIKSENEIPKTLTYKMNLTGLSPYWFDVAQGNAVLNTVKMETLFLLTGPNGGGKSSLLRSLSAAALLGICGLMVPAESAIIPHFDAVVLHMKAYDSPSDGKSSFQIEMSELRSIVAEATPRSLVMVDEICRGTETAKGTCIAGSIVETLDQIGCLGIVSTHLHSIFDLPLNTKNTKEKAMGTQDINGRIKPTWKLIDGICRESLAFETALKEGFPEKLIERARELYLTLNPSKLHTQVGAVLKHSHPGPMSDYDSTSSVLSTIRELQKEVDAAVTIICQTKLIELYKKKSISEIPEFRNVAVGARELPPPSTVGSSSIYVLLLPDNKLYVGQTDDLLGRVCTHRSKEGMQNVPFLYAIVPGKSLASLLETLLINQLPLHDFQLANKADGKHRNFGISVLDMQTLYLHK